MQRQVLDYLLDHDPAFLVQIKNHLRPGSGAHGVTQALNSLDLNGFVVRGNLRARLTDKGRRAAERYRRQRGVTD